MRAALLTVLLALAAPAAGQGLVDPMRPSGHMDGEPVVRPAGPVLEQVVLAEGRRFAVISGRRVAVGDRLGDATVVAIGPDQVTLKGPTLQVLRMFPLAERKSQGAAPSPQPRKAEEGS